MSRLVKPVLSRRTFLQVSSAGVVTTVAIGGMQARAKPYGEFTWISPRGTLEVLDDYAYWVAKEMGYFGDHKRATAGRSRIDVGCRLCPGRQPRQTQSDEA